MTYVMHVNPAAVQDAAIVCSNKNNKNYDIKIIKRNVLKDVKEKTN